MKSTGILYLPLKGKQRKQGTHYADANPAVCSTLRMRVSIVFFLFVVLKKPFYAMDTCHALKTIKLQSISGIESGHQHHMRMFFPITHALAKRCPDG